MTLPVTLFRETRHRSKPLQDKRFRINDSSVVTV